MATDRLSSTFAALADPTRRAILARLALGETSVLRLAEPFDMSLPAISKHLKVLERAGLITRTRDAQMRPCRIDVRALKEADDWLEEYRLYHRKEGKLVAEGDDTISASRYGMMARRWGQTEVTRSRFNRPIEYERWVIP